MTYLGEAVGTGVIGAAASLNPGKWIVTFDPRTLGISIPEFECYHIAVTNGPPGSKFTIYIGSSLWDSVAPGDTNSWDPAQPMPLEQGQSVYFYWNTGNTGTPMVTMWLREPRLL